MMFVNGICIRVLQKNRMNHIYRDIKGDLLWELAHAIWLCHNIQSANPDMQESQWYNSEYEGQRTRSSNVQGQENGCPSFR